MQFHTGNPIQEGISLVYTLRIRCIRPAYHLCTSCCISCVHLFHREYLRIRWNLDGLAVASPVGFYEVEEVTTRVFGDNGFPIDPRKVLAYQEIDAPFTCQLASFSDSNRVKGATIKNTLRFLLRRARFGVADQQRTAVQNEPCLTEVIIRRGTGYGISFPNP